MRKLASIQKIVDVIPIKDADKIELVKVMGWQCVAKKDEFKKDDLCVYFEIDSFLPINDKFEFLRASSYRNNELLGEGFKLRTVKMRGELSQGLCLPIDTFKEDFEKNNIVITEDSIGLDVSDVLGVRKWEILEMASSGGTIIGDLPYGIPHTDETRIQNVPELINAIDEENKKGNDYYISTKMDGSSHSIMINEDNEIFVTGHNFVYADDGKSDFYEYVKKNQIIEKIQDIKVLLNAKAVTIQGEFCGPGIQKNRMKLKAPCWYVFVISKDYDIRLGLNEMLSICEQFDLYTVPIEEVGSDFATKYPTSDDLLVRANGDYHDDNGKSVGKKEGIVVRTVTPVRTDLCDSGWLSLKAVSNNYLLKNDD